MRKRNCRVQVRLDNKEYQGFMKAVRKSGLSQEVYLRHLINGVVPQDAPPVDDGTAVFLSSAADGL